METLRLARSGTFVQKIKKPSRLVQTLQFQSRKKKSFSRVGRSNVDVNSSSANKYNREKKNLANHKTSIDQFYLVENGFKLQCSQSLEHFIDSGECSLE